MRGFIPTTVVRPSEVAEYADAGLRQVEETAKQGIIPNSVISPDRSQLFDDNGTLKFYSAITGTTSVV